MHGRGIASVGDYAALLGHDPAECGHLIDELLLRVASFFRDPAACDALEAMLPPIVARANGRTVGALVPACSTGEEAHTVAILLREAVERTTDARIELEVFDTDIGRTAIDSTQNVRDGAQGSRRRDSRATAMLSPMRTRSRMCPP
jgi:two-component system CheB/CheR fusion protein